MAEKLGFTWYPKDWWTSDTFHDLDAKEKYIYLECLFLMYANDGYMNYNKSQLEKRFSVRMSEEEFNNVMARFENSEKGYTSLTVNKRLRKAITSQENGKKGGRPRSKEENNTESEGEKNPENPEKKPKITHLIKEKEKEKENRNNNEEFLPPPPEIPDQDFHRRIIPLPIDEVRKLYDQFHTSQREQVQMAQRLTNDQMTALQNKFDTHVKQTESTKSLTDYTSHLRNWTNTAFGQSAINEVKKPQPKPLTAEQSYLRKLGYD